MTIIVDGLSVSYGDEGKGPVVILLHGWGQASATFEALAAELSKVYRVIRVDLPGFGASQRPEEAWGVGEYATFIKDFLAKLKVDSIHAIVGHSLGGRIAIKAVGTRLLHPERLVLMNSAGIKQSDSPRNQALKLVAKIGKLVTALPGLRSLRRGMRQRLYESAGSTDYLRSGSLRPTFLKVINEDLQADAAKIKVPTLLIWGNQDTETPVRDGQRLHQLIGSSRLEVLSAGHFSYLDQPRSVARLMRDFFGASAT